MISENIRKARKERGMSQEELAVRLHVVRQTVSKWEKGLSVPDADLLCRMAELLEVPVHRLLGAELPSSDRALSEKLAALNEDLAERVRREKQKKRADNKRGLILFLTFLSMLIALTVKNELVSLFLILGCMLAALIILYRNLALLTGVTTENFKTGPLLITTLFDMAVIGMTVLIIFLNESAAVLSGEREQIFVIACIVLVMLFAGFISPKLPFNRHTGLRLPWTVRDEETWNLAHKTLGWISAPVALLYLAAVFTINRFELVTLCAVCAWIGIPGLLSLLFFWKKFRKT